MNLLRKIRNNFLNHHPLTALTSHISDNLGTSTSPPPKETVLWQSETGGWVLTKKPREFYSIKGNKFKETEFARLPKNTPWLNSLPKYVQTKIKELC